MHYNKSNESLVTFVFSVFKIITFVFSLNVNNINWVLEMWR